MIALPRLKIERGAMLTCHTAAPPCELQGTEESGMNGGFLPCGVVSINVNHMDPGHHRETEWRNFSKVRQCSKVITPLGNHVETTRPPNYSCHHAKSEEAQ